MTDLVERLERELHAGPPAPLEPRRLADIRRAGRRRRTGHRLAVTGASALAVAVLVGGPFLVLGGEGTPVPAPAAPSPTAAEDPDGDGVQASPDLPEDLAALQERILAEVPGAVRTSPTQVDLPDPRVANPDLEPPATGYSEEAGRSIGLGVASHSTPDTFAPGAFPDWLVQGWRDFADRAETSGDPDLTALADGAVRAEAGELRLASSGGSLVLLERDGLSTRVDVGDLADLSGRVLDTSSAEPPGRGPALGLVAIATRDGSSVGSVTLVDGSGARVEANLDDTLLPGVTLAWAEVRGGVESFEFAAGSY